MANLKQQIIDDTNEVAELQPRIHRLQDEIAAIEAQIVQVGGLNYKQQKDEVEATG